MYNLWHGKTSFTVPKYFFDAAHLYFLDAIRAVTRVHNQKFASVPDGHNLSRLFLVSERTYYSSHAECVRFWHILDAFSIPATPIYINHHGQSR